MLRFKNSNFQYNIYIIPGTWFICSSVACVGCRHIHRELNYWVVGQFISLPWPSHFFHSCRKQNSVFIYNCPSVAIYIFQDVQTISCIEFLGILSWLISPPVPSDSNTRDSINISQCLHKVSHCEHIIQIESEIMCDVTIIMWIWMPWPGSQSYLFEIFGPNTAQLQIKPTKKQPISDQIMQIMVN